jgi:hypothetical protein
MRRESCAGPCPFLIGFGDLGISRGSCQVPGRGGGIVVGIASTTTPRIGGDVYGGGLLWLTGPKFLLLFPCGIVLHESWLLQRKQA